MFSGKSNNVHKEGMHFCFFLPSDNGATSAKTTQILNHYAYTLIEKFARVLPKLP